MTMNRRSFLSALTLASFYSVSMPGSQNPVKKNLPKAMQASAATNEAPDESHRIAQQLFDTADEQNWKRLSVGEIMAKAGATFVGTPYVGGTLETGTTEHCTVNLQGLDCVTFFENMLAFARCVKKDTRGLEAMKEEVEWTRYRDGKCTGYTSRLHYTGDWIVNNVAKDVVFNITQKLGGVVFPLHVDFMSKNPQYYKALQKEPDLVAVIADQERTLSARRHWYIPVEKIAGIESQLRSGDIIAIATSKQGLDYSHTGMISKSTDGVAHFLHASLAKKQVVLDDAISVYVRSVKTNLGISVLRPRDIAVSR